MRTIATATDQASQAKPELHVEVRLKPESLGLLRCDAVIADVERWLKNTIASFEIGSTLDLGKLFLPQSLRSEVSRIQVSLLTTADFVHAPQANHGRRSVRPRTTRQTFC